MANEGGSWPSNGPEAERDRGALKLKLLRRGKLEQLVAQLVREVNHNVRRRILHGPSSRSFLGAIGDQVSPSSFRGSGYFVRPRESNCDLSFGGWGWPNRNEPQLRLPALTTRVRR